MTVYPKDLDPQSLEPYYSRHIMAMTAEDLHEKSDIALQLAWRDKTISVLELKLGELSSHKP